MSQRRRRGDENILKIGRHHPKVPRDAAVKGASGKKQGRKKVRNHPEVLDLVDVNQHMDGLPRR
jgi:hypothetical protein